MRRILFCSQKGIGANTGEGEGRDYKERDQEEYKGLKEQPDNSPVWGFIHSDVEREMWGCLRPTKNFSSPPPHMFSMDGFVFRNRRGGWVFYCGGEWVQSQRNFHTSESTAVLTVTLILSHASEWPQLTAVYVPLHQENKARARQNAQVTAVLGN